MIRMTAATTKKKTELDEYTSDEQSIKSYPKDK